MPSLVYIKVAGDDRLPIGVVTDLGVCPLMPGEFQDLELLTLDGKRRFAGRVSSREPNPFCWIDSNEQNLSSMARVTDGAASKPQEAFLFMRRDSAAKICTGKIDVSGACSAPVEVESSQRGIVSIGPIFTADGTCLDSSLSSDRNKPIVIYPLKRECPDPSANPTSAQDGERGGVSPPVGLEPGRTRDSMRPGG